MTKVFVLYPNTEGTRFNWDYYFEKHIPLVEGLLKPQGLVAISIDKAVGGPEPNQPPAHHCIFSMTFNTLEQFQQAFQSSAEKLMADIPNYTDTQPVVEISEVIR